jgi:hypothetical protein
VGIRSAGNQKGVGKKGGKYAAFFLGEEMSWIDTFSIVGLLLALGAALDFCIREPVKVRVANSLIKISSPGSLYAYGGSKALDAVFGQGLFSPKAIFRYAAISFTSIALSYAFAYSTTPITPNSDLTLFPAGADYVAMAVLTVCVIFAILGDVASYSITRVFVRAVDSHKNAIVAAGLIVADFVSSLFLFFFTFSLSRVVSFILVINFGLPASIVSAHTYLPEMVREGMPEAAVVTSVNSNSLSGANFEMAKAVADINQGNLAAFVKSLRALNLGNIASDDRFRFIEYSASLRCVTSPISAEDATLAATETASLLKAYAQAAGNDKYDPSGIWEKWAKKLQDPSSKCTSELTVARTMPLTGLVGVAGPANTYLAAVERTLFDAYQILAFKLAPYVAFNPVTSLKEFASSIQEMEATSLLGMSGGDPVREAIVQSYVNSISDDGKGGVNVPFSPMVASSLTSSLFFGVYLLSIGIARIAEHLRHLAGLLVPKLNVDVAPFTAIGLASSFVCLFAVLLCRSVDVLWLWLFS